MSSVRKFIVGLVFSSLVLARPVFADAPGCYKTGGTGGILGIGAVPADVQSLGCLADSITSAIKVGLMFLGALTLLYFIFGAIKFVVSRGDQKALQGAKGTMTYAAIAALLVLGAYTLISLFTNTLGLPDILNTFTLYQNP